MTHDLGIESQKSTNNAAKVEQEARKKDVRNRWLLSSPALLIIFFAAAGPLLIVIIYSFLTLISLLL